MCFFTSCHCNKHSSLIISPIVWAIFISLQCAKCINRPTSQMTYSGTTFCSLSYCSSHVTILVHLLHQEKCSCNPCRNEFGRQNNFLHASGQWHWTVFRRAFGGGGREESAWRLPSRWEGQEEHTGWCPQISPTPPSCQGSYIIEFCVIIHLRLKPKLPNEQTLLGEFSFLNEYHQEPLKKEY